MSTTDAANPPSNASGGANPIFCVASVRAGIDYSVNALGFKVNWDAGFFASSPATGANIRHPPTNHPWAYECRWKTPMETC